MKTIILIIVVCSSTGCITFPERQPQIKQEPMIKIVKAKPSCMNLYITSYNSAIIKPCSEEK